jgi:hypothetical protein
MYRCVVLTFNRFFDRVSKDISIVKSLSEGNGIGYFRRIYSRLYDGLEIYRGSSPPETDNNRSEKF